MEVDASDRRIFDISPEIGVGIDVWPGDSPFEQKWSSSLERGDHVNVAKLTLSPHTGAHADAPLHVKHGGADSAGQSLEVFWGVARVLDWRGRGPVSAGDLKEVDWTGVRRALFRSREPGSRIEFDNDITHFEPAAAEFLVALKLLLVGIDSPSVDSFSSTTLETHHVFLEGDVSLLESLELGEVTPGDYELVALPLRLRGSDASPVRAVLRSLK